MLTTTTQMFANHVRSRIFQGVQQRVPIMARVPWRVPRPSGSPGVSVGVSVVAQRAISETGGGHQQSAVTSGDTSSLKQSISQLFGEPVLDGGWVGGFHGALRHVFPTDTDHANLINLVADPDSDVVDVCFDLGRCVTVHFRTGTPLVMNSKLIDAKILAAMIDTLRCDEDVLAATGRMGIPETLHRVSILTDFDGLVSGLTWRVGREVSLHETLTADLKTFLALGKSVILFGKPGVGKTTTLRGAAAYLADHVPRRTVVVDATGELGGYATQSIGIGANTRRMCVAPGKTHGDTMLEVIRNHTPQAMVVDELMTRGEAALVQTCHARGVQILATVHADTLSNVVENPVFNDLMGGSQSAAVSDAMAQRKGGAKFVRSRKHPPVFDGAYDVETKTLYTDLASFVDRYFEYQNV